MPWLVAKGGVGVVLPDLGKDPDRWKPRAPPWWILGYLEPCVFLGWPGSRCGLLGGWVHGASFSVGALLSSIRTLYRGDGTLRVGA